MRFARVTMETAIEVSSTPNVSTNWNIMIAGCLGDNKNLNSHCFNI